MEIKSNLHELRNDLQKLVNPEKAKIANRFFKTKEGEYGFGDSFLGINVPTQQEVAKRHKDLSFNDIEKLLTSKFHEERLIALFILVLQFKKADEKKKKEIFDFYLKHTKYVNNWDLVDSSADKIVGRYLSDKSKDILYKLAKSRLIWERRIAVVSTYEFIRNKDCSDALKISAVLLNDKEDLIQKAVGWMLREVGKKDQKLLVNFLKENYFNIPRTTLRYAIEKFSPEVRVKYLKGEIW